jgi:hypothetical protein
MLNMPKFSYVKKIIYLFCPVEDEVHLVTSSRISNDQYFVSLIVILIPIFLLTDEHWSIPNHSKSTLKS